MSNITLREVLFIILVFVFFKPYLTVSDKI